jgi:hypothetical protein
VDVRTLECLTLTDADSQLVRLGDLWAGQPVILVFLRHFG